MGLMDDIVAEANGRGRVMRMDVILSDLSDKDRADLEVALADLQRYSNAQIQRALAKNGHDITQSSVRAYRIKRYGFTG